MPAEFFGVAHIRLRSTFDQRRRSERRACDLRATIRTPGGDLQARLVDISADGVGIEIDTLVALRLGTAALIVHSRLGEVPCVLRWAMHPRYGAEFRAAPHALARVHDFYDSLPPGAGEIL